MLRAGNEYTFHRPFREGDAVTVRWFLADLQERSGSDGRPMLVVTSEIEYFDQHGEAIASNRETVVYRPIEDVDA
jgi:acyl dehydratase